MSKADGVLFTILVVVSAAFAALSFRSNTAETPARAKDSLSRSDIPGKLLLSKHYAIHYDSSVSQAQQVAIAAESLYTAYSTFFAHAGNSRGGERVYQLVLYKDRNEFNQHNRSSPWAEGYYKAPYCYAYFGESGPNRYHWMLHEATHQLNSELAGFKKTKWIDEGLASYFGASKIENGILRPGVVDPDAYPIWWLSDLSLSGDSSKDVARGKIIPLRAIVSGDGGPDFAANVNLYYIEYWSLTHFLFTFENGKYAAAYKRLILEGGSVENFERLIGPFERIQKEWYDYLRQRAGEVGPDEVKTYIN